MKESTLGEVPKATAAATATSASSADHAGDSNTLGGVSRAGFGQGIVSGSVLNVPDENLEVTPYGEFAAESESGVSVPAIAPVDMTIRDFVAFASAGLTGENATVSFMLVVVSPTDAVTKTQLCQLSGASFTRRVDGPIAIQQGSQYNLRTVGKNLPMLSPPGVVVSYQYRAAAG